MFSSVSNVLPLHIRQELPAMDPPVQPLRPANRTAAAAETPRPATAAERRNDAGQGADRNSPQAQASGTAEPTFTEDELREIRRLRARDAEVRAHEQAHAAAGGSHAGAPNFAYERGPDGRMYAVSGHVGIDAGEVAGDPEATLRKMQQIQRAALAPAEPSAQDRKVAAKAAAKASRARQEIQAGRGEESSATQSTAEGSEQAPQAPGGKTEAAVVSQRSGAAYEAQAQPQGPQLPELDLLACRNCGGVHPPS